MSSQEGIEEEKRLSTNDGETREIGREGGRTQGGIDWEDRRHSHPAAEEERQCEG